MPTDSDQTASCGLLADYLTANKDGLIEKWLVEARRDRTVLSDKLNQIELTDHLPKIFDSVVAELRNQCGTHKAEVKSVTARHTVIRWLQEYDLRSVIREVSILRAELVQILMTFHAKRPEDTDVERLLHSTIIHRILDDIVFDATETFIMLKTKSVDNR